MHEHSLQYCRVAAGADFFRALSRVFGRGRGAGLRERSLTSWPADDRYTAHFTIEAARGKWGCARLCLSTILIAGGHALDYPSEGGFGPQGRSC